MAKRARPVDRADAARARRPLARKRAQLLALLGIAIAAAALVIWLDPDRPNTPLWVTGIYPAFCFAASIKAFRTSARLIGRERRAWQCFAGAGLAYGIGEMLWGIAESVLGEALPTPSIGDAFYLASPLLFITGFWCLQTGSRSLETTLIKIGNFGIILATVLLAYMLVYYELLRGVVPTDTAITGIAYGILDWSAPLFGFLVVYTHLWGRRRLVMLLLMLGLLSTALTNLAYIYSLIDRSYSSSQLQFLGFSLVWCFVIWAAFERDWLIAPGKLDDFEVASALEQRAKQWSTLLPALAVAGVLAIALLHRERLTAELQPFAAATFALFVVSLSIRSWWSHRAEVTLRSQVEASEAQLQSANRELWLEMQTRTRVEAELRQAQKMEALGQLTGGVAHDFNNLLAVILGNLEAAEARAEDRDDLASLLRDATDAAARGAALTQRLLALSRKQALKPEPIDPGELVSGMSNLLERSLGAPIAVQITRADDVRPCIADPTQLESAILNLAINARDAMPDGGVVAIDVANAEIDAAYASDHPIAQPGSYVEIRVRDTGAGIDPAILPRVFDPFFTTKEIGAGTGLGLSMVYGFARQSGGHVTIGSELGRGTEVRLYLPACPERSPFGVDRERDETPRGHGESILVVEDQPAVRRLVGRLLEDLGYRVGSAADGAEALRQLAERGCVDLLLSDVVLPGDLSGRELALEARARKLALSALLMSGYAPDAGADERAPEAAARLLHKPFRRSELARRVRGALDARETG